MSSCKIRPHHGLCVSFFVGKGYDQRFISHMTESIARLDAENPTIELITACDLFCSACPRNTDGTCDKPELTAQFDRNVLTLCGLEEHDVLLWQEFREKVRTQILEPKLVSSVCKGCQWACWKNSMP